MNKHKIRKLILDALDAAYVSIFTDPVARKNFLSGTTNYSFEKLDMDSLGMMEFCMSLEMNGVISITPEELLSFSSLDQLEQTIMDSQS